MKSYLKCNTLTCSGPKRLIRSLKWQNPSSLAIVQKQQNSTKWSTLSFDGKLVGCRRVFISSHLSMIFYLHLPVDNSQLRGHKHYSIAHFCRRSSWRVITRLFVFVIYSIWKNYQLLFICVFSEKVDQLASWTIKAFAMLFSQMPTSICSTQIVHGFHYYCRRRAFARSPNSLSIDTFQSPVFQCMWCARLREQYTDG